MKKWIEKYPLLANIILIFFSLCFAFLAMEAAVRVLRYYQCQKISTPEQYKKMFSDDRCKDYVYGHKPNAKVRIEKDGRYISTFITNSDGLREAKDRLFLEKSVIFLVDSVVETATVENEETMDKIFEDRTGVSALNFGLGGANTVHEYYWLKNKYKKDYNTKLIILGFCLNDFEQNTILRYFDASLGMWRLYKYLNIPSGAAKLTAHDKLKNVLKKSRLISFLHDITRKKNYQSSRDPLPSDICEQTSMEGRIFTELYMMKIKEFAKSIGSKFVVVIFPDERQLMASYDASKKIQDILMEILKKNNIRCIDLYKMMKEKYRAHPDNNWYYDDLHFNKAGHELIGEYLAEELPKIFHEIF